MRDILEQMRDEIVASISDKGEALSAFDSIGALIDKAMELTSEQVEVINPPAIQVVSVSMLKDILNESLSNALTPFQEKRAVSAMKVVAAKLKRPGKRTASKKVAKKSSKKR